MSKRSLLVNRLLMAQGAIALFEKNLKDALILAEEYDKVHHETGDKGQRDLPFEYSDYQEFNEEEIPF